MTIFEDHGLPLVYLKELRRELIMSLACRHDGPVSSHRIAEIASVQHAIAAMEAVIVDLDAENGSDYGPRRPFRTSLAA